MRILRVLALAVLTAGICATVVLAAVPAASTGQARNVTQTSARLLGTVDPNQEPTTWYFEYGTTASYGSRTPDQGPLSGNNSQAVQADIGGLAPGTEYHYRVAAVNASGSRLGRDRQFRTPAAVSLAASRNPIDFGESINFSGGLAGTDVAGKRVVLEQNIYPFTGYTEVGSGTTDGAGRFAFLHAPLANAAYRVTSPGGARSNPILALVRNRITIKPSTSRPGRGRSVLFTGTVTPNQFGQTVYIQRLGSRGWRTVLRAKLSGTSNPLVVSYAVRLRRVRSGSYRAYIPMTLAHLSGASSSRRVTVRG